MKKDWTDANIKQINSMRNNLIKYYRGKTDDREISLDDIKNKAIIEKIVSDNNYDFIGTHHNKIYQIYDKPSYGSEQKKKIASIIYKYFELKKNTRLSQHWHAIFKKHVDDIFDNNNNTLSERQINGWVYMDELKDTIDKSYPNRLKSLKDSEKYLLLLIHYCGPLRSGYYFNLKISNKILDQQEYNYIFIPKAKRADGYYYVYDDKVSDTKSHASNNKIPLKPSLKEAIKESIDKFPRDILLPSIKKETDVTILLKEATGKDTNNQILRTSYESERYLEDALIGGNYAKFSKECKNLRHNVAVVMTTYLKSIHLLPKLKLKLIDYYVNESKKLNQE